VAKLEYNYAYEEKQIDPLVGGTIRGIVTDDDGGYWGVSVYVPGGEKRYTIWILQDEEANGPGAVDVVLEE